MNNLNIKSLWRSLMVLATASVFGLFMSAAQAQDDDTTDDTCTGTAEECAAATEEVEATEEEGSQPDNTGKAVSDAAKGLKGSEDPSTDAKALKDTAMENLPEQANRPDAPEGVEVPDRPERPELPDVAQAPDRPERPEVPGRPESPGKP